MQTLSAAFLFKIERQRHHARLGTGKGVRILDRLLPLQIRTVLFQQIEQSETKLQLRAKTEERQINIAPDADFHAGIESFQEKRIALATAQIEGTIDARRQVRPAIVQPQRGIFDAQGKLQVAGTDRGAEFLAILLPAEHKLLVAEINRRNEAQVKIGIQIHIADDADAKTRRIRRDLGIPCFAVRRHARMGQDQILRMDTHMETQMKQLVIHIRLVLYLLLLAEDIRTDATDQAYYYI